jgi:hypothetical protein
MNNKVCAGQTFYKANIFVLGLLQLGRRQAKVQMRANDVYDYDQHRTRGEHG